MNVFRTCSNFSYMLDKIEKMRYNRDDQNLTCEILQAETKEI